MDEQMPISVLQDFVPFRVSAQEGKRKKKKRKGEGEKNLKIARKRKKMK